MENTQGFYRSPISEDTLKNWFTYHAPVGNQLAQYAAVRQAGFDLAKTIMLACPPGSDCTAAIRKVREAVMTANAAIACGEQ